MKNPNKYFQPILIIGQNLEQFIPDILSQYAIEIDIDSPDFIRICPVKEFAIADSRQLIKKSSLSPLFSAHKVILAENFTKASIEAQNSLLKLLEEPSESTLIILFAENKNSILPTILSRIITVDYLHQTRVEDDITKAGELIKQILDVNLPLGQKIMLFDGYKDPEIKKLTKQMLISLNRTNISGHERFLAKSLLDIRGLEIINVRTRLLLDNIIIAVDQLIKKGS